MLVAVELSPNPQTSIPMSNKRQAVHKGRGRGRGRGSGALRARIPRDIGAQAPGGRGDGGGRQQGGSLTIIKPKGLDNTATGGIMRK